MKINTKCLLIKSVCIATLGFLLPLSSEEASQQYKGKAGATGWKCHVVLSDPEDHGPDGINWHDWDGDGYPDLFVNYEEGKKSCLFFNPGPKEVHKPWKDYISFEHGQCEDSGHGDLDNDGDIDYIANGGHVFFNPGKEKVKDSSAWIKMTLFNEEARVPTVIDMDHDGLNDLLVAGNRWYKQPQDDKHNSVNWQMYKLTDTKWVMNNIYHDMDLDGHKDLLIHDRRVETFWLKNPGGHSSDQPWSRHTINPSKDSMFMMIQDINYDGMDDLVITHGQHDYHKKNISILLRENIKGAPRYKEIILPPAQTEYFDEIDYFPKGVAYIDVDPAHPGKEILILPKMGDMFTLTYDGDPYQKENWMAKSIPIPGSLTRRKMDNIYVCDIDLDGDMDFATTEENGGWGVIWFENPSCRL